MRTPQAVRTENMRRHECGRGSADPMVRAAVTLPTATSGENREQAEIPTWPSTTVLTSRVQQRGDLAPSTHPSPPRFRDPAGRSLVDRGRRVRDRWRGPPSPGIFARGMVGASPGAKGLVADLTQRVPGHGSASGSPGLSVVACKLEPCDAQRPYSATSGAVAQTALFMAANTGRPTPRPTTPRRPVGLRAEEAGPAVEVMVADRPVHVGRRPTPPSPTPLARSRRWIATARRSKRWDRAPSPMTCSSATLGTTGERPRLNCTTSSKPRTYRSGSASGTSFSASRSCGRSTRAWPRRVSVSSSSRPPSSSASKAVACPRRNSELLARDLLIPVAHGVTYDEIRAISPLLGSRNGLSTDEDSLEGIAKKIAELVDL